MKHPETQPQREQRIRDTFKMYPLADWQLKQCLKYEDHTGGHQIDFADEVETDTDFHTCMIVNLDWFMEWAKETKAALSKEFGISSAEDFSA